MKQRDVEYIVPECRVQRSIADALAQPHYFAGSVRNRQIDRGLHHGAVVQGRGCHDMRLVETKDPRGLFHHRAGRRAHEKHLDPCALRPRKHVGAFALHSRREGSPPDGGSGERDDFVSRPSRACIGHHLANTLFGGTPGQICLE